MFSVRLQTPRFKNSKQMGASRGANGLTSNSSHSLNCHCSISFCDKYPLRNRSAIASGWFGTRCRYRHTRPSSIRLHLPISNPHRAPPPCIHILKAQLVSAPRVRVVLSRRKLPYIANSPRTLSRFEDSPDRFECGGLGSDTASDGGSGSSIWSRNRSIWGFTE